MYIYIYIYLYIFINSKTSVYAEAVIGRQRRRFFESGISRIRRKVAFLNKYAHLSVSFVMGRYKNFAYEKYA